MLVASLALSSAFDMVNIDLQLKCIRIIGLPNDVISLITVCLNERMNYVSIDIVNSVLYDLLLGTVQVLFLGLIIYSLFVSPLFYVESLLSFVDDSYISIADKCFPELIKDMQKTLEAITKWLRKSGLKPNQA